MWPMQGDMNAATPWSNERAAGTPIAAHADTGVRLK
jgi:hypothetical protein